ncbi:MAG: helix-turn-helix transcriptional regulator [Sphaerochaetaceae bacterium]|jgi:transcriptional regulator with XRE-family HTH domain
MIDFWKRVEALRKTLGMTQRELSVRCGFPKTKIEAWLVQNPQPIPKGDACVALAKALGTSVEYLVTGEEYNDEENEWTGKRSGRWISDDPVFKLIADDPELYQAAQLIASDRKKALAVIVLAGEQPCRVEGAESPKQTRNRA